KARWERIGRLWCSRQSEAQAQLPTRHESNEPACAPPYRQPFALDAISSLNISARLRGPGGVCGSLMIVSVHRRAADMSPAFHAESARVSRALCRKARST